MTAVLALNALRLSGLEYVGTADELEALVFEVSATRQDFDSVRVWFRQRTKPRLE